MPAEIRRERVDSAPGLPTVEASGLARLHEAGEPDPPRCQVLTVGHSTRPIGEFLALLVEHGVTHLIDVRSVPRSRHNPQFNEDLLPTSLAGVRIAYTHVAGLGGFRRTVPDSPNTGWRNLSFRGYADYMQTLDFTAHLASLIEISPIDRVAVMCAEAVPWRCHRSLIADALLVQRMAVCEIVSSKRLQPHTMTSFARVEGEAITYPPADGWRVMSPTRKFVTIVTSPWSLPQLKALSPSRSG